MVLAENRILLGLEQESLTIRFSIVDAAPPVQVSNIRWFFTAGGMDESNAIDITEQTTIGETVLTFSASLLELTISSITQGASGIYTLVATNPAGTGSNFTDLEMVQGNNHLKLVGSAKIEYYCTISFSQLLQDSLSPLKISLLF